MSPVETFAIVCHPVAGHGGCYMTVTGTREEGVALALICADQLVAAGEIDDRDDFPWELVSVDRLCEFKGYTNMGAVNREEGVTDEGDFGP